MLSIDKFTVDIRSKFGWNRHNLTLCAERAVETLCEQSMLFLGIYLSDDQQITIILLICHFHSIHECLFLLACPSPQNHRGLERRAAFLGEDKKAKKTDSHAVNSRFRARKTRSFQYSSHTEHLSLSHRGGLETQARGNQKDLIKQHVAK